MSDSSPAIFNSLSVSSSSHIAIDSIVVNYAPTSGTYSWSPAVGVYDSSNITFAHSTVTGGNAVNGVAQSATETNFDGNVLGLATGYGITISNSSGVTVEGVDVSHFYKGVVLNKSDYVTISHSDIHDTRTTPIVAGGGNHITIDSNHLHDVNPWHFGTAGGDHGDYLAMWTVSGQTSASNDIKVTNNLMEQGKGQAVLGMWLQGDAIGYTNVQISGNAILGGNFQGIMTWDVTGGSVDHNTLLQTSGTDWSSAPSIIIGNGSEKLSVHDNLTSAITEKSGSTGALANVLANNTIVSKWIAGSGYYTNDLILKTEALHDLTGLVGLTGTGSVGSVVTAPVVTDPVVTSPVVTDPVVTAPSSGGTTTQPSSPTGPTSSTGLTLSGDWSAKTLTGGAGNDTFFSKNGADTLSGGAGDDTYNLLANKTLVVEAAGGGTDTVIAKGDYTLAANVENLTISSSAVENWAGTGNSLNNLILGNAGGNFLSGLAGNDTLSGGAGNDYLIGGAGADRLVGGTGKDTFMFAPGGGQDVVADFTRADHDSIDISAFTKAGYKATVTDVGTDVKISFATGDAITLTGIHAKDLIAQWNGFTI